MSRPPVLPFLIGALSLIAAHAPAQEDQIGGWHRPLWESAWDGYSPEVEPIGDVTGDGVGDFIESHSGRFHVVSGHDGSTWYDSEHSLGTESFSEVQIADVDGDGLPDLVAAFPFATRAQTGSVQVGRIVVIQGGSTAQLWEVWGDQNFRNIGYEFLLVDLTGNGLPDITTYAHAGHRSAFQGFDGRKIWEIPDPQQSAILLAGDSNADGINDLLISQGDGDALIDGATGSELWSTSRGFEDYPSQATVLPYDITGNGSDDFIICEPFAKNNEKGWVSARSGADGSLLWRRKGSQKNDRLGMNARLEDLTGDGLPELVTDSTEYYGYRPATLYVLDPRSGARIWRYEWSDHYRGDFPIIRADLNRDGNADFVLTDLDSVTLETKLVALDARTGINLWPETFPPFHGWFRELKTADLNQDGVPDFIASGDSKELGVRGVVMAYSGVNGRLLWKQEGKLQREIGLSLAVQVLANGECEAYSIASPGPNEIASLIAWDGESGNEKWRVDWSETRSPVSALELVDLNRDGAFELLALTDRRHFGDRDFLHLFDTTGQGRLLWSAESVRFEGGPYDEDWFGAHSDADGDGWLDLVLLGSTGSDDKLIGISGKSGTWIPGIEIDDETVSASVGGSNALRVDAHSGRAGKEYLLLFSENGPGATTLGSLDLPLAPGLWLSRSAIGIYPPGTFNTPTGHLDADGKANIQIEIPATALSAWVGRELSFCVAVKLDGQGGPDWTTGFSSMRILP